MDSIKLNTKLRLSKNVVRGKRYDVNIIPLPVELARKLALKPKTLMEISYDPKIENTLTLRWNNVRDNKPGSTTEASLDVKLQE